MIQVERPPWWLSGVAVLPGVLKEVGLRMPHLAPQQMAFLQVEAVP